jgi:hypothetical protein
MDIVGKNPITGHIFDVPQYGDDIFIDGGFV